MPPKQQEVIAKLNDILKRIEAIENKIETVSYDKEVEVRNVDSKVVDKGCKIQDAALGSNIKSRVRTVY